MKMLFVCEGLTRQSIVAQPWKHVIEIARRIKNQGEEVEVVSDDQRCLGNEKIMGVSVYRLEKHGLFFNIEKLSRFIAKENADVISWHCSDIWSSVYFWRLRKKLKTNLVWTLHSGVLSLEDLRCLNISDYFQLYKFWNNIFSASLPKSFIRKWTAVPFLRHTITLSKRTTERLKDYGLQAQDVTPIPSGVDVEAFSPSKNREGDNILYFGPLSSLRGIDDLLSAFKVVRKSLPSSHLVLLARASPDDGHWLRKAESMPNVEIVTGMLDQASLVRHLDRASVVVLPFKFWPQVECPLTVLEGMAMEKTVVTTFSGAIPEMVDNWKNGVLVQAGKPKRLAETVVKLLNEPSRVEEIGRNARSYVKCFHDWNKIVKDTLNVLSIYSD